MTETGEWMDTACMMKPIWHFNAVNDNDIFVPVIVPVHTSYFKFGPDNVICLLSWISGTCISSHTDGSDDCCCCCEAL
jgi:hypothetical protein